MGDLKKFACVWLAIGVFFVTGQRTFLDSPGNIALFRAIRKWTGDVIGRTGSDSILLRSAKDLNRVQDYYLDPFPCNTSIGRSSKVPETVHQLRPGDIDVIGAMGDSLSAGLGIFATNIFQVVIENRGVTATIGGQSNWREFLTLPNIIKEFNPSLIGYALTDSFIFEKASQFNVAESGAMSRDMPYMAQALVNRMKSDPRVNLKKHWKLITFFIGANDFCVDMCYLPQAEMTLSNHKADLLKVLKILRDQLPRTFVQIMPPPHLQVLVEINARSSFCETAVHFECPCLFGLARRKERKRFYDIMTRWQEMQEEIVYQPEFQKEDFAVVFQPVFINITFPTASNGLSDMSYFSADCFHVSQKSNAMVANSLWNNLLQPVGKKYRGWTKTFSAFECPSEKRPYIATLKNSKI